MSNYINIIFPYKYHGMWVFDDPLVDLRREAFIAGADTVLDMATKHIPRAGRGFSLLFSESPFPGEQLVLVRKGRENKRGNTYLCKEFGLEAWLCPALYKYFVKAPKEIHASFMARERNKNESKEKNKQKESGTTEIRA